LGPSGEQGRLSSQFIVTTRLDGVFFLDVLERSIPGPTLILTISTRLKHRKEGQMSKLANPDYPIHDLLVRRWSPYGFESRPVPPATIRSLFEAARWAASSYNEQPWRYIVASQEQPEEFAKLLSCLVEPNQQWAKAVPVLGLGVISLTFSHNGKPNGVALHDLGAASAQLTMQATVHGLHVHQMAGILPDKAREVYQIPEGFQPYTGIAIGYVADPSTLPDPLRTRDTSPRPRKPLGEIVFGGKWGQQSSLVKG
jgi:nitroreductase